MALRVLHLSDVHIGRTYKRSEDIAYKIILDIGHHGLSPIDCVAVTGDIFDGPAGENENLIMEAVNFFTTLLNQINSHQEDRPLDKSDFIFVPGNHDIIRIQDESSQWNKYKRFLSNFYNGIPEHYDKETFSVVVPYQQEKIVFVGFNSCQIENKKTFDSQFIATLKNNLDNEILANHGIDKDELINILESEASSDYDDYGHISMSQIFSVEKKLKQFDDYDVVALFHHHFFLFPETAKDFGDSSLIRNYTEVTQHLKYMNVKTVLHGHKHFDLERPFITDDYYNTTESIIDVFSAGSVGTSRKERHTFGVIDFYDDKKGVKLIHNKFVYNGELLDKIVKKQIPPQNLANRTVKVLDILKSINPEAYSKYVDCSEKIFKIHHDCNKIISWVSEALTGFKDVYSYLDSDYKNILFLLYAINLRTLHYRSMINKEDDVYHKNMLALLSSFFSQHLETASFSTPKDEYHRLFRIKDLRKLAKYCDNLFSKSTNKTTNTYLAFSMVGIFFTDLNLVLTKYADDFKESIKYKVNIKIEDNKFHENVPAPRIVIQSNADRRSAYIKLRCNEATAHKMAVLFVKEFDLLINNFEDYFKVIGLKLYYLLPEIDKDNLNDTLDNYNFEAYIPTLLPLLTGDNIYPSKKVFARELIQNSIDAIAVREAKDAIEFTKNIMIELNTDENGKKFFKIIDRGTGMDRYKIERYFTSIGRSFYSGDEYADLQIAYKPISSFGIGFLSSFMVCREIDVKTKYYEPNSETLMLHIPNYDGCFFIERATDEDVGTELKLYINAPIDDDDIIKYVQKIMVDIKYEILIKTARRTITINPHQIRVNCKNTDLLMFIPFTANYEVLDIEFKDILNGKYEDLYEYGLLISNNKTSSDMNIVLNAGILVEDASINDLFNLKRKEEYGLYRREESYNNYYFNFPANWIQLDVSREKLTGFSDNMEKMNKKTPSSTIGVKIANSLYKQIIGCIEYSKNKSTNLSVVCLQEVIQCGVSFCENIPSPDLYKKLMALKYCINISFNPKELVFEISRNKNRKKESISIQYHKNFNIRDILFEQDDADFPQSKRSGSVYNEKIRESTRELYRFVEEFAHFSRTNKSFTHETYHKFRFLMERLGIDPYEIKAKYDEINIFHLLALFLLYSHDGLLLTTKKDILPLKLKDEMSSLFYLVEITAMRFFTVHDVENGNNKINVNYDDVRKLRPMMDVHKRK